MESADDALARRRFMMINLVRLSGVAFILGGLAMANDALPFEVPDIVAYGVVIIGMVEVFAIPILLSRAWSTNSRR